MGVALLEALAASSLWVAAAAAALCAAAGRALGVDPLEFSAVAGLAASGTLVVYNVDRLRDLERDRATTPRRAAFVERHRGALFVLTGLAALAATLLAWREGPGVLAVLLPVLALGLGHRRLKRFSWWKPLYVGGAWVAVTVGLPAVARGGAAPGDVVWIAAIVGAGVLANAVASNVRDGEAPSAAFGPEVPLRLARAAAALGAGLALLAPPPARPLGLVPLATLAALVSFHPGELYGLVVVDGALLAGALAALVLL